MEEPPNRSEEGDSYLNLSFNKPHINALNELTLVGKLITHKTINFKATIAILSVAWELGPNISFQSLDRNTFSCTFKREEDRDRIIRTGPWAVKGAVLVLTIWRPELSLDEIDLKWCPFWVQIFDLPSNRMNEDNAGKISDYIGRYLHLEDDPLPHCAHRFLRIRFSVNSASPLVPGCHIKKEDGTRKWISFKYERLPEFCYSCGLLDHMESACTSTWSNLDTGRPQCRLYGVWLRAGSAGGQNAHQGKSLGTPGATRENLRPSSSLLSQKPKLANRTCTCPLNTTHLLPAPPAASQTSINPRAPSHDISNTQVNSTLPNLYNSQN